MTERLTLEQEKALVLAAKKDVAKFAALYEHYLPKIFRYVKYRIGTKEQAEDITSQVFVQAIRNFERYEWRNVSFGAWLYRIAHNMLVNEYRNNREIGLDSIPDVADDDPVDEELDRRLSSEQLKALIAQLPTSAQEAVRLRVFEELSYEECAAVLDTSVAAVKMQVSRAIKKLSVLAATYATR